MLIINANSKEHFFEGLRGTNVGAGLLANAVCQSAHLVLIERFREQARSHTSPVLTQDYSALHSARQLSSMRLEKPHSLSYHANTLSNLPLTLV